MADSIDLYNTQQEAGYERSGHAAYGLSKLALNMWSYKVADDLKAAGSNITLNCVDPGTVGTKLLYAGWGETCAYVAQHPDEADDVFWSATDPALTAVTGQYFVNRKARKSPSISYSKDMQNKLWQLLAAQTGAKYHIKGADFANRPMNLTNVAVSSAGMRAREKVTLQETTC